MRPSDGPGPGRSSSPRPHRAALAGQAQAAVPGSSAIVIVGLARSASGVRRPPRPALRARPLAASNLRRPDRPMGRPRFRSSVESDRPQIGVQRAARFLGYRATRPPLRAPRSAFANRGGSMAPCPANMPRGRDVPSPSRSLPLSAPLGGLPVRWTGLHRTAPAGSVGTAQGGKSTASAQALDTRAPHRFSNISLM
jgi:hypothetical protein